METQSAQRSVAVILGPSNWEEWIRSIQRRAETLGVWKFVNPTGTDDLQDPHYPEPKDIKATANVYSDLDDDDKEELKEQRAQYRQSYEITRNARLSVDRVSVIIERSINPTYLSILNAATTTRDALKNLRDHLQPASDEAKEALKAKYRELCKSPSKAKVEQWTLEWESAFREAQQLGMITLDEETMSQDFLAATKKFTPELATTWIVSKRASKQKLEFYETVREFRRFFRLSELSQSGTNRPNAFSAATLQGQTESPPKSNAPRESQSKKPCLCGESHSFRKCPYLVMKNQTANWQPDLKIVAQIKQKIESSKRLEQIIKQFIDTKTLGDNTVPNSNTTANTASDDSNAEANKQKSKLKSGLVATSLYANSISSGLHPLKDSVVWDSGAACHICNNLDRAITPLQPLSEEISISTASGDEPVVGIANIAIQCRIGGRIEEVVIKDVYFAPTVVTTLISGRLLRDKGVRWNQDTDCLNLDGYEFCQLETHEGLWTMEYNPISHISAFTGKSAKPRTTTASPSQWHQRLGHCGPEVIRHLIEEKDGISVTDGRGPATHECETCAVSKAHQIISRRPAQRANRPFGRVHFDLIEFERGFDGSRYVIHFVDDATRMQWVYLLSNKSQSALLIVIKYFVNMVERTYGSKFGIAIFRTDQEKGIGKDIERWLQEVGVTMEYSATYTPEQNGSAERSGGVLEMKARCIRIEANLPEEMWPECILTAAYLLNRTPVKQYNWKSPLENLSEAVGQQSRPELAHLKVFGCRAYPLLHGNDKPPKSAKLRARAAIGHLVGYENQNTYRIWIPSLEKVIGCRDVTFDESKFFEPANEQQQSQTEVTEIINFTEIEIEPYVRAISEEEEQWLMKPLSVRTPQDTPASSATELQEIAQKSLEQYNTQQLPSPEPSQPSGTPQPTEPMSEYHSEVSNTSQAPLDILEPLNADLDTRNMVGQRRDRKPTARAQGYAAALIQAHSDRIPQFYSAFSAGISQRSHRDQLPPPPASWRALTKHSHAEGFRQAAKLEYEALKSKDTFRIIKQSPQSKPLPLKWHFTYKFDQEGYLMKYKARICVRGDLQPIGLQETYAATLAFRVFRALMALSAAFGLIAEQLDAVTAFLNAKLDEVVYVRFPEGFEEDSTSCLRLLRALYGLRRSPLLWLQELTAALIDLGLRNIPGEPCLFTNDDGVILFFYVDDIVLLYHPTKRDYAQSLKQNLQKYFEIRDLGDLRWFLGVRVLRNIETSKLWLCQDSYLEKIATNFNLQQEKNRPYSNAYRRPSTK